MLCTYAHWESNCVNICKHTLLHTSYLILKSPLKYYLMRLSVPKWKAWEGTGPRWPKLCFFLHCGEFFIGWPYFSVGLLLHSLHELDDTQRLRQQFNSLLYVWPPSFLITQHSNSALNQFFVRTAIAFVVEITESLISHS